VKKSRKWHDFSATTDALDGMIYMGPKDFLRAEELQGLALLQ
jgi:hypothetical protein